MRPAGRGETDSLYFDYPHFAAPQKCRRDARKSAKVAVIGAGPVGMTAALALAKQGIASILFDRKPTFNDGSRAICVARPSFYILEHLGVVEPFLNKALGWTTGRSFYRGRQILEFQMPDTADEKFRPMYNIQQQFVEKFLWDAVGASDLIETRWQSAVEGIDDLPGGLRLTVSDPAGEYTVDADWVLACDGARSSVRAKRGLRLRGQNLEGRYIIADVQMDHDYPTIRRALFDPECRPGGTVLIHRQPDNIWRIDYQLAEDESTEAALNEATVRRTVQAVLDDIGHSGPWELEWWSVYTANTLALDDYRCGRVFFVGDSAHIVPIFGVRGLNNGIADAANIGWKLGWVLNGRAGEGLLDSYSPERRGATLDVFANASKSARFMTPSTHGWRLMRDAVLSLALDHPVAGELANPRQMTAHIYADSPAVCREVDTFQGGPAIGALFRDVALDGGFLSDRFGAQYSLLCFDAGRAGEMRAVFAGNDCVEIVELPFPSAVAIAYGAGPETVYLLRPDAHVAGRWQKADAATVLAGYRAATFQAGAAP